MATRIMAALKGSIDRRTRIDTAFWLLGLVVVIVFLRWTVTPGGSSRLADFLAWVQGQGAVGANLSDYMPSRIETAERMLEVAGVGPDQVFLDIGSGDGRLVVLAARAGAEAIGIDRQELLVERARDNAAMAGVADRAQFVHADALDVPSIVERADVVAVFLTIAGLSVVGPYLAEVLRPGAIVVSNTFAVPGWRPESVTMVEVDRRWGRTPVYRYRVPEAFAGDAGN